MISSAISTTGKGSCFGFAVTSDLFLNYLRDGSGVPLKVGVAEDGPPEVDPDLMIVEWTPTPQRPLRARLYEETWGYQLWIDGGGWYGINMENWEIAVPPDVDPIRREERLWGLPTALCFLARGERSLHAAAVEVGDGAVLLAGPSRHGKTTLAAGFLREGFRVLTEDVSCFTTDDQPVLFPGPAMLRVRRDVAATLSLPNVNLLTEDEDRAHFALDHRMRGNSDPLPIKAIVLLNDEANEITVQEVATVACLPDLWLLSLHLPNNADRAAAFEAISNLADRVPVFSLVRPTTIQALPAVVDAIASTVQSISIDPIQAKTASTPSPG